MLVATREIVIADVIEQAEGIRSYRLESIDDTALEIAPAGAHIDIHLPDGMVRQYSLCHDPAIAGAYLIAIKREPASRGGSSWFHDHARVGVRLKIGSPRSLLSPSPLANAHLLIAGGIGVTPLYSMAQHFLTTGEPFELHYFARSQSLAAFATELASGAFKQHVHFHFGLEPADLGPRIDRIFDAKAAGSHLYICGPAPFMDAVRARATDLWPLDAIHEERFAPAAAPAKVAGATGSFEVTLAKTGRTLEIPTSSSILDVLMANGHDIEHSCEQGFCGSCMTALLEGEADHRDTFLTPEELSSGEWIMPCVSRARSARLVLDL